jgi:molecular chaperone DnaJ
MLKRAMLKPECYEILGLPMPAHPAELERAYRRILLGEQPDSARFRDANEAYETLRDMEMRPGQDLESVHNRRPLSAEPPRQKASITVPKDFQTVRPSIEELLDHFAQNFFSQRSKSGGPYRKLDIETLLQSEDARFGCRVPIRIQYYEKCDECRGSGLGAGRCPFCHGYGVIESAKRTVLEIPPGARDGQRYQVNLGGVGITNLLMQVRIILH